MSQIETSALSNFRKLIEVCVEHVSLKNETHEFTLADDLDEAGRFELFDVVRKSRRTDLVIFRKFAAGFCLLAASANRLENLETPGLRQRLGD